MKKISILIATFVIAASACMSIQASTTIIDAKTLANELKTNKEIVIIDVQAAEVYAKQHIQGSINIPHKSLYKTGPIEGQFLEAAELATIFGKKGVSNTSKIILYDDGSQKYNSRVWWVLKYLGATDVTLFHKEKVQMEAARIPMTAAVVTLKATTFEVNMKPEMNIDMPSVVTKLGNPDVILVDAREKDEFDGMDKDKRSKGHLPGAIYMNIKEVLTATGAYKTKEELIAVFAKFNIASEKEVLIYCQTGIKAAVIYVALKEIVGFPNVKLYAGAYAEWASVESNPVVK